MLGAISQALVVETLAAASVGAAIAAICAVHLNSSPRSPGVAGGPEDSTDASIRRQTSASRIQRSYRKHRDVREDTLGFTLRKQKAPKALQLALKLWNTGEERPAGGLTVQEKHELLSKIRKDGASPSLRGLFGHSVLSRVANLGKGITEADNPMLLAQHQWLEATDRRHRYGAYLYGACCVLRASVIH